MGRRFPILSCLVVLASVWLPPTLEARSTPQAFLSESVYAVCPGTALKKLDADVHVVIETAPRNASAVDVLFSGTFRPLEVDPDEDIFKKKFKGTLAGRFDCANGSTVDVPKATRSSLGGEDKNRIIFSVQLDLTTCPPPVVGWMTFDAKGGSVDKKLTGDPVPLNFSFCAFTGDAALGFVPNLFTCSFAHPLADQCP